MLYIVMEEVEENRLRFINNEQGISDVFLTEEKAEEERIYLQPDFENKLKVISIV